MTFRVIVPVSGGKDSQVCVALAIERYGADHVFMMHQNTGFDHKVTYDHLEYMQQHYQVPLMHVYNTRYKTVPEVMLGELIVPSAHARMCTRQLKTGPWFKWLAKQADRNELLVYLGMRVQESSARKENYGHLEDNDEFTMADVSSEAPKSCSLVRTSLPIVTWSTARVFEYLQSRGDKVNPLYSRGHSRVGCYPCVLAGKRDFTIASWDPQGREHMLQLDAAIEVIKKARPDTDISDFFKHDIKKLLATKKHDPFGLSIDSDIPADEPNAGGCSWCTM